MLMVEMLSYMLSKAIQHVSGGRHSVYAVAVDKRGRILTEAQEKPLLERIKELEEAIKRLERLLGT